MVIICLPLVNNQHPHTLANLSFGAHPQLMLHEVIDEYQSKALKESQNVVLAWMSQCRVSKLHGGVGSNPTFVTMNGFATTILSVFFSHFYTVCLSANKIN